MDYNDKHRYKNYEIIEVIGKGSYGTVYKSKCKKSGKILAIKESFYDMCVVSGFGNLKELDVLSKLSNISISPILFDVIYNDIVDNRVQQNRYKLENITIVNEIATTDGFKYFRDRSKCTFSNCIKLSYQLMVALNRLHLEKITHRDVKPGNILIFETPEGPHLKLCDFGFANFLCELSISTPNTYTAYYRAPEILWEIPYYGVTADVWAAACTIYEMFTGKILFENVDNSNANLFKAILERIPCAWNNDISTIYSTESKVIIQVNNFLQQTSSFMSKFRETDIYNRKDDEMWKKLNNLLIKMFNFNYRLRYKTTDCLKDTFFSDFYTDFGRISSSYKPIVLENIKINQPQVIHEHKVFSFNKFLISPHIERINIRVLFHALDLFNLYYLKFPKDFINVIELEKIVSGCVYFFHKYFSTMIMPHAPELFFPFYDVANIKSMLSMDSWIYTFEKKVLEKIFRKKSDMPYYEMYRLTPYEMHDQYIQQIKLNNDGMRDIFHEFLNTQLCEDISYRAMYRDIIRKKFRIVL